jgi:Carboxypeptidase regulatory-like domain
MTVSTLGFEGEPPMKQHVAALILLVTAMAVGANPVLAKDKPAPTKTLTGRVSDHQDQVLPQAVVYLSNTRTQAVKSYIVGPDGTYRFPALSPSIDYEVYAQYNGHKSETKTVSQFDDRQQVSINLRIDTK